MSESTQPTHHGYAVRVKDHTLYSAKHDPLSEGEAQDLYDSRVEDFWELVQEIARDHGFSGCYSLGRMGGWAQPYPQPDTDDMWEEEAISSLAAWMIRFRAFERGALALMESCREEFLADLSRSIESARREPIERAYWESRDVVTIDT